MNNDLNNPARACRPGKLPGLLCMALFLCLTGQQALGQEEPSELAFAQKLYDDGLYLLAAQQYGDFVQRKPSSPLAAQARFMAGKSFYAQGDLVLAEKAYRELLAEHPQSPFVAQAWFQLGTCLSQTGHFTDAADAFVRGRRLEPEASWAAQALLEAANALRRAGEPEQALDDLDAFVLQYPQSPRIYDAHMVRGEILAGLGQFSQARSAYQAAAGRAASEEQRTKARYRQGRVLILQGDRTGAVDLFSQLIGSSERSVYVDSALYLLGDLQLVDGQYDRAAEAFAVLASRPEAGELPEWGAFQQAEALRLAGDYREATSAYRNWLARYPKSQRAAEVKLGLSASLRAGGDLDSAVVVLENLAREDGDERWGIRSLQELGDVFCQLQKFDRALTVYRELLGRYPQIPHADSLYFRTAEILELDLNRPQAALRIYQTLSSLYPQSQLADDGAFAVGRCHEASGNEDQALQVYGIFAQEYALSPLYPQAQRRIGYLSRYRVPEEPLAMEAVVDLHDQLSADSLGSEEMDLRLAEIYFSHLKNFDRAASALERFLQKHPGSPLADEALFQLSECHRARVEIFRDEGDARAAAQAEAEVTNVCRRLLRDFPQSAWADRCALDVIADVLRSGDSQGDAYSLDLLDLYGSFLRTYAKSRWRGYALLRMGTALEEQSAEDARALAKADSLYTLVASEDPQGVWADTAAIRRVEIAARRGADDAAMALCEAFLLTSPESDLRSKILFSQAQIYARRQDHRRAARLFRSVAEDFPYHELTEDALLRWAQSLSAAGDVEGARMAVAELEERYPESPFKIRAWLLLARHAAERGNTEAAQGLLSSIERDISGRVTPGRVLADTLYLSLGDLYLEAGLPQKAMDSYQTLLRDAPGSDLSGTALGRVAAVHFRMENFIQAQNLYQQALSETVDEAERAFLQSRRIICFYRLGQFQEALRARKEFEKVYGTRTDLMAELLLEEGLAYLIQEQMDQAAKSFQAVLKDHAQSVHSQEAEYQLGLIDLQAGDFSNALARFQSLVDQHPEGPRWGQAMFKMGSAFYALERYDQAAEHYERGAERIEEDDLAADALFNAGICRGKMNDWDGAAAAYRTLLQDYAQHEDRQKWALRLGFAHLQAGLPAQALQTFSQIDPGKDSELGAEIQFWVSECYFHMGEYERAAQEYLRVAYLYPQQAKWATTAEYNAGIAYEKLGRVEEARSIYRKLLATLGADDQWGAMAQERLERLGD